MRLEQGCGVYVNGSSIGPRSRHHVAGDLDMERDVGGIRVLRHGEAEESSADVPGDWVVGGH